MKFLLKLFCLLSLVSSFCFANLKIYSDENLNGYDFKSIDMKFLKGNNLLGLRDSSGYHIYSFTFDHSYYSGSKYSPGFYWGAGNFVYFGGDVVSNHLYVEMDTWSYTVYSISDNPSHPFLTYSSLLFFRLGDSLATCGVNQEFDTETNKCVDPCPAGQFWDIENNLCYSDCSDKDLNKFGFPNGTSQGGCVDCSNAFGDEEISSCICSGFGSGLSEKGVYLNLEGNSFVSYNCADGSHIVFKRRLKENPDKEKEKEKENENEKDKNENGNNDNTGEQDNNPSDNNSGGTAGNGSSGGGGSSLGSETKPNPNYKGEEGKEDGKGEEGKQGGKGEEYGKAEDNVVAGRLDYGNLEKDMKDFKGDYSKAVEDSFSFVNDVKVSLSDTISKIKDGNLMSLKKSNIPSSCPLEYKVNLIYFEKELIFDICKAISPASQTLYYFFYVAFFVLFLVLIIKLFLFTFMGW